METLLKQLIDNMYEILDKLDKVEKIIKTVEKKLNDLEEKVNNQRNIQQNILPVKKEFKIEEIVYPNLDYII
jgi:hypothetical protein